MTAWSRLNGGRSTGTKGSTHPVTTTVVVEGLKMKLEPLKEVSEIIQADGQPLKLLGLCRMFLESDNLGG